MEFSLSPSNFRDIPFQKYAKDFTFIVNGQHYETSRFIADILSPTIRKMHYNDENLTEFVINTALKEDDQSKKENISIDYFNEFLQLVTSDKIYLDEQHQEIFSKYFYQLGNFTEYLTINPLCNNPNETSEKESVHILQDISDKKFLCDQFSFDNEIIQKHVINISKNISKIDQNEFKTISIEILAEIIRQDTLTLDDEDFLLNLIIELYSSDHKYSELFEFVEFRNVSEKKLKEFIDLFDIDDLTQGTWRSICARLIPSFTSLKKRTSIDKTQKEFKYQKGQEFQGIMHYLTSETGGNIHDNGTIEISSNSLNDNSILRNTVNYQSDTGYFSKDEDGSYLCFDFKEKEIQVTDYSIKSYGQDVDYCHPKNWVVEVSKDGKEWTEIDRHENDPTLNGMYKVGTFNIKKKQNDFYRFIKIRQTGQSWDHRGQHYYFGLDFVEFYGKIHQKKK